MSWQSHDDGCAALFDPAGRRKYLTYGERSRFLKEAAVADAETAALAQLLAHTGCRVSEALELTPGRLDAGTCSVVFRTLKRRRVVFRAVPVPEHLMKQLMMLAERRQPEERLWSWCRQTAWRHVKRLMAASDVRGAQAMPKGLRHGFGIANAEHNVPAALTRIWMGHARIETTAIYQHAVGEEERAFAKRLWSSPN